MVRSPFWSVSVAVPVPDARAQVASNSPFAPPLSVTARSVRGMSGSPVNVDEFLVRSTAPVNVSGNGGGNTSVNDNAGKEPVRYAVPESAFGYSGDVALTEPTGVQLPLEGLAQATEMAPMFGTSTVVGKASDTVRLGASRAPWVTSVVSLTWLSPLSRAAVTLKAGA